MFRTCHIIIRELCSLLKLYYSIRNSIRICKRGVVAQRKVAKIQNAFLAPKANSVVTTEYRRLRVDRNRPLR